MHLVVDLMKVVMPEMPKLRLYCLLIYVFLADIRRSNRPFLVDKTEDDFFQIDVRIVIIL